MLQTWPERIAAAIYLLVCAYALLRGGDAERRGAWIVGLAAVATVLAQDRVNFLDPDRKFLIIDGLQLAAFIHLLARHRLRWVVAATGLQTLALLTHVALVFSTGVSPPAYLHAYMIWNYGVVLSLGAGAVLAARRRRSGAFRPAARQR